MNILLITDLEGVPGITDISYMERTDEKFQKAAECLTECINKTAQYCYNCGAESVYYFDGHGGPSWDNVIAEKTDSRLIKVDNNEWQQLAREGKIQACIELGSHARAGTIGGFLDHTMSSKTIFSHRINGKEQSELSLHAYFLGEYGVPTIACIGDKAACDQAKEYIPEIYTACVKIAEKRNQCTEVSEPYKVIEEAVKSAMENISKAKPITLPKPVTVEITYYRTDMCEARLKAVPQAERVDARTLRKVSKSIQSTSDLNI